MTTHSITLAGTFEVAKGSRSEGWVETASIDLAALGTSIVEALALHGLKQKIADAASQAKTPDEAKASMQKAIDALIAGEWSSRGGGEGVGEEVRVARSVTKAAMKASLGAKSAKWATFTGMSDADQAAKLDETYEANKAKLAPMVEAEMARREEARKAKAKLGGAIDISL